MAPKKALHNLSQKLHPTSAPSDDRPPPTITSRIRGGDGEAEGAPNGISYITSQPWFIPGLAIFATAVFISSHTLFQGDGTPSPNLSKGHSPLVRKKNLAYRGKNSNAPTPEYDSMGVLSPTTETMGHYVPRLPELSPTRGPIPEGVISIPTTVGFERDRGRHQDVFPLGTPTTQPWREANGSPVNMHFVFPAGTPTTQPWKEKQGSPVNMMWTFPAGTPTTAPWKEVMDSPVNVFYNKPPGTPTTAPWKERKNNDDHNSMNDQGGNSSSGGKAPVDPLYVSELGAPTSTPWKNLLESPSRVYVSYPDGTPTTAPWKKFKDDASKGNPSAPYEVLPYKYPAGTPTTTPWKNIQNPSNMVFQKVPQGTPTTAPWKDLANRPQNIAHKYPIGTPTTAPWLKDEMSWPKNQFWDYPLGFPTTQPWRDRRKNIPTAQPVRIRTPIRDVEIGTNSPTDAPTAEPTTKSPTKTPTLSPTRPPIIGTYAPTISPTPAPTDTPTKNPTRQPVVGTYAPTSAPTPVPTDSPTKYPTKKPTPNPTPAPTRPPIVGTYAPTISPTKAPTAPPTPKPTTMKPVSFVNPTEPPRPPVAVVVPPPPVPVPEPPKVIVVDQGGGGGFGGGGGGFGGGGGGGFGGGGGGYNFGGGGSKGAVAITGPGQSGGIFLSVGGPKAPPPTSAPTAPRPTLTPIARFTQAPCPATGASDDDVEFKGRSGEDEAIYELFYTNPETRCGIIVEIGAGDGEEGSASYYFQKRLNWKAVLIEANPNKFGKLEKTRGMDLGTEAFYGGFCDGETMSFAKNKFYMPGGAYEVSSEVHAGSPNKNLEMTNVPCLKLTNIFRTAEISKIDVFYIRVNGDALSVIRAMEWRVRSDIWVLELDGSKPERDEKVREVLLANEYVKAAWDIKRWCDPEKLRHCMPNEVFLKKGFTPLPEEVQRRLTVTELKRRRRRRN